MVVGWKCGTEMKDVIELRSRTGYNSMVQAQGTHKQVVLLVLQFWVSIILSRQNGKRLGVIVGMATTKDS